MRSNFSWPLLALALGVLPAHAKPEQIRGVQSPIYHLYLQAYPEDPTVPVVGPESESEYFDINGSIRSTNTSMYLNIAEGESTSYRTLVFGESAATSAWGLEGDTIITTRGSSWGRQLNFLACQLDGDYWQVYLQTGSQTPSGRTCSNYQTLHLPCLC
ncbi:hypothetical protein DL764_004487 [Monosporascus ibericus]|uniref:Uncharacterized protein n=1 Tax=Monosporascus ibericus TaxID=155417 RepID=A0A4Q4TGH8_9PEZI|nr:hypothetical protein DL764_004487 [Monosporascus ibericus]